MHLTFLESEDWKGLIGFRDFLRNNKKAMEEYAEVKKQAAKMANQNGEEYRKIKEPFFKQNLHNYPLSIKDNNPSPNTLYPIEGVTRTVYLKNIITNPQIIVGDYTYYDDPDDVYNFEKNVLYLFDFMGDKLIIGKFCQIATGVRFIMNGSNHAMNGFSTYPFKVFGKSWALKDPMHVVSKGDTVVGNDVWIGNNVTIMQGIKIGDGAIIGTNSLVTKDVEPYTIVGGNPAREIRKRFDEQTIQLLLALKWWDWNIQKITDNLEVITGGQIDQLKKIYKNLL